MDSSLKKSRHQKQQKQKQKQQQQQQAPKGRRKSNAAQAADPEVALESLEAKADQDSGELSPQSRRRYQSRKSSARLRERQRQRIHSAEEEVLRLEGYVRALQQSIDVHKRGYSARHGLCNRGEGETDAPSQAVVEWSDEEARCNFSARVRQLILSLSDAVHQLGGCVERIDVLKALLTERIALTERKLRGEDTPFSVSSSSQASADAMDVSPPPYFQADDNSGGDVTRTGSGLGSFLMSKDAASMSGSVSGNNSSSYSGTGSGGSATLGGSIGGSINGSARRYDSPMASALPRKAARPDGSSRIPISFLVDGSESNSDEGTQG